MILLERGGNQPLFTIDFSAHVGLPNPLKSIEVAYNKFGSREKQNLPHIPTELFIQILGFGIVSIT
jgi:hypothetical protein